MRKASAEWLRSAQMDLESVAQIVHLEHLTPITAFHAQQCVEKCFKAILEEHLIKVPKDHSTLRLCALSRDLVCIEVDSGILTDLDSLYIEARYPGELGLLPAGKPTLADAREFFDVARASMAKLSKHWLAATITDYEFDKELCQSHSKGLYGSTTLQQFNEKERGV